MTCQEAPTPAPVQEAPAIPDYYEDYLQKFKMLTPAEQQTYLQGLQQEGQTQLADYLTKRWNELSWPNQMSTPDMYETRFRQFRNLPLEQQRAYLKQLQAEGWTELYDYLKKRWNEEHWQERSPVPDWYEEYARQFNTLPYEKQRQYVQYLRQGGHTDLLSYLEKKWLEAQQQRQAGMEEVYNPEAGVEEAYAAEMARQRAMAEEEVYNPEAGIEEAYAAEMARQNAYDTRLEAQKRFREGLRRPGPHNQWGIPQIQGSGSMLWDYLKTQTGGPAGPNVGVAPPAQPTQSAQTTQPTSPEWDPEYLSTLVEPGVIPKVPKKPIKILRPPIRWQ